MISDDCEIKEFFEAVRGKPIREAILLANQEATHAQRVQLFLRSKQDSQKLKCSKYPDILKEFIRYLRYAAKPKISGSEKYNLFNEYLKSLKPTAYRD